MDEVDLEEEEEVVEDLEEEGDKEVSVEEEEGLEDGHGRQAIF